MDDNNGNWSIDAHDIAISARNVGFSSLLFAIPSEPFEAAFSHVVSSAVGMLLRLVCFNEQAMARYESNLKTCVQRLRGLTVEQAIPEPVSIFKSLKGEMRENIPH
jgi:hypothetical protein